MCAVAVSVATTEINNVSRKPCFFGFFTATSEFTYIQKNVTIQTHRSGCASVQETYCTIDFIYGSIFIGIQSNDFFEARPVRKNSFSIFLIIEKYLTHAVPHFEMPVLHLTTCVKWIFGICNFDSGPKKKFFKNTTQKKNLNSPPKWRTSSTQSYTKNRMI